MGNLETFNSLDDLKRSLPKDAVKIVTNVAGTMEELCGRKDSYYRGLPDASWKLYTSVQREWIINDRVRFAFSNIEEFIRSFADFLKLRCSEGIRNSLQNKPEGDLTDFETFSCAQHFGGRTPFLDFSKSAATALHFMSAGLERSSFGYGAIWEVDSSETKIGNYIKYIPDSTTENREKLNFEEFNKLTGIWVEGAPVVNARSFLQDGLFMYRNGEEPYSENRPNPNNITSSNKPNETLLKCLTGKNTNEFNAKNLPMKIPVKKVHLFPSSLSEEVEKYLRINGISKESLGLNTFDWAAEAYANFLDESLSSRWKNG